MVMSQNVPGSPVLKYSSKCNEVLLRTLHSEVRILTIYAKCGAHFLPCITTRHSVICALVNHLHGLRLQQVFSIIVTQCVRKG